MKLENLAETRPYLKESIALYRKVKELEAVPLSFEYGSPGEHSAYTPEDASAVLGEFARIFGAPEEDVLELKGLLVSGEADFLSLPASEAQSPGEASVALYIISRPFFKALSRGIGAGGITWEEGRCPVCNAVPSLSVLGAGAMRRCYCSFCGTTGYFRRTGCPNCKTARAGDIEIIFTEELRGMRLDACRKCKTYVKSFEVESLAEYGIMELDLISLPLDIVARGKGFIRRSPNPIGMTTFD